MKVLTVGLLALAAAAPALAQQPPPDRPKYFSLYPPPPPGTFSPSHPPASTATRRPDLFAPQPVYRNTDNWLYDGALDARGRVTGNRTRRLYFASGRLTVDYIKARKTDGDERGGARLQVLAETASAAKTTPDKIRLSEAYFFYKFAFPGAAATLRAGQFVLPFGLAAVYDTPLQPIQPLYEKSIGLRVDSGAMLEGEYGPYHYAASLSAGSGPNRSDQDHRGVVTVRLDRHFLTQAGRIQIGGSMLTGRLPKTTPSYTLPASGFSAARDFEDKTRFAADAQYFLKKLTARGEVVFGANGQKSVFGFFGEGNYAFDKGLTAVAEVKRWDFPEKPKSTFTLGAGVNIDLGNGLTLRTLYEYESNTQESPGAPLLIDHRIVFQTRFNF